MEIFNMVKNKILFFIFLVFCVTTNAQKVSNITFKQEQSNIVVFYDLETKTSCKIDLFVSTNRGTTWQGPLKKVIGDVGTKVITGKRSITWNVLEEFKELTGTNIKFQVRAEEPKPQSITTINKAILKNPKDAKLYVLRGDIKLGIEDYGILAAWDDYNKAISINPRLAEAYKKRADVIFYTDSVTNFNKIIKDYNKAISLNPKFTSAYFNRALAKLKSDDFKSAITDFDKVIELDSLIEDVFYFRGFSKYKQNDLEGAIIDYDTHILKSNNPKMQSNRIGRNYFFENDFYSAVNYFTKSIESKPIVVNDSIIDLLDNALIMRGITHNKLRNYGDAKKDFNSYLSEKKIDEAYFDISEAYQRIKDYTEAIFYINRAITIEPKLEYYYLRFILKKYTSDYNGAISDLSEIINIQNQAKHYVERAYLKNKIKDYYGAISDFSTAIELEPDNINYYSERARLKNEIKDYKGAISDYSKAIDIDASDVMNYYYRANLKYDLDDFRGAISDFSKVIALSDSVSFDVYGNKANSSYMIGDYKAAILDFNKAINISPVDEVAQFYAFRGLSKINLKDKIGGCKDLTKAGELGYYDAFDYIKKYCN